MVSEGAGETTRGGAPSRPSASDSRPVASSEAEPDAVAAALAKALGEAAAAARFDVVAQLARELEARRSARASNVVAITTIARRVRSPGI